MLIVDSGCLGQLVNFYEIKKRKDDGDCCSVYVVRVQWVSIGYRVDRSIISMRLKVLKEEM